LKDGYDVKSDYKSDKWWNIYVASNVKNINAVIYADWWLISSDSSWVPYEEDKFVRTDDLQKQLIMKWTLFTRNTIWWAILASWHIIKTTTWTVDVDAKYWMTCTPTWTKSTVWSTTYNTFEDLIKTGLMHWTTTTEVDDVTCTNVLLEDAHQVEISNDEEVANYDKDNKYYVLPWWNRTDNFELAMIYDLNYIRRWKEECIHKSPTDTTCKYNDGAFIIIYDPKTQANPPKLFDK
jgi:hypothetical protein